MSVCVGPPFPLMQPGSQYRTKAEPMGAVQNGKWVPKDGVQTLMGTLPPPVCRDLDKC